MAFNVLTNKYVLYVLLFLAITNVLGYLAMHDYESLTLMVAIGALTHYFSRNMIVILSAAILGAVLLRAPMRSEWAWAEREGFKSKEGMKKEDDETKGKMEKAIIHSESASVSKENMENEQAGVDLLDKKDKQIAQAADESEEDLETGGEETDYASALEKQFNSLKSITKGGKMSDDTKGLMVTGDNLAEQIRQLEPMLKTAEGLMAKLEGSGMLGMVERFAPLMERFIPAGGKK
tara:strand:- start:79 stop:783 length:705 start_codon:yes stop_codon:yes gene_type:complete